ncbi:Rha family transcriptional regulator [Hymenobacter arizonensis]|uniref:Phage regulatory protein, rha family n=1 Tax=Hymenobacter arizonensis TaxID=1227077 RepID=A0A1I5T8Z8_HYMAR|nr:Rha family transcriptional regulator [Hymenobacter arizonensis]SFP79428.1 phage regulatory protein, rha family [Hymenobacter arizonensis]
MSILVYSSAKGNPVTDSRRVAQAFGKTHKAVLRALSNLYCDAEFSRLNFAPITYLDQRKRQQRAVVMTRSGFTFLAMGFTGHKAAEFKQGYIAQFERMEAQLQAPQREATPLTDFTRPDVQVQRVKATASRLLRLNNDPNDIMNHHRGVMKYLTARTPSQYVRDAVARGLRVRALSGRQVLRRLEPAKAAAAAFMDEQVERGRTLEQLAAAGIPQALPAAFAAMLRAGITPAELPPA